MDAHDLLALHHKDGTREREIPLPGLGDVTVSGRRRDSELFYSFTSFTCPTTVFRCDPTTGASTVFRQPKLAFDPAAYETVQVFYPSKDGTRIPLFITSRKGTARDGQNPTLLSGYGGFNVPMTPAFSPGTIAWLEMGGVSAVACLRGGGEYGKDWYDAGRLAAKQNVFDDFVSAAEYLIGERYTSVPKLAIAGGSNGGLLVGAVLNQRPELFGAALPAVGVMDMLRFHLFTIGWAWKSDYASSETKRGVRDALRLLAAAQHQARDEVPRGPRDNRRSRRPRGAGAQLQVRCDAPGRTGGRGARADPDRDARGPRRRQADEQDHRRGGRPLRVPGQESRDAVRLFVQ